MGRYVYSGTTPGASTPSQQFFFKPTTGGASPFSTTWTVPTGVTCATFEVWGGGGEGSPMCCCTCYGGNPGAGGGYAIKTIPVSAGTVYTIQVGQGGCGNECWYNSNACGCAGQGSYVTGTGLSNLCATGGAGGTWCNAGVFEEQPGLGYGGDYNFYGKSGHFTNCNSARYTCRSFMLGGASTFGGGWSIQNGAVGAQSQYVCGITGSFPGGGSPPKPVYSSGWCDCFTGCTGGGADGLVIITT